MKKILLCLLSTWFIAGASAQIECNIENMQGVVSGGYLTWIPGESIIYVFIDPADDYAVGQGCGASYPWVIETVEFNLGDATIFVLGDGIGTFSYQVNVYTVDGDACNQPGAFIGGSGAITIELDGGGLNPQSLDMNIEVNDAFFISYEPISWTGDAEQVPTILWDNLPRPECVQYFSSDGGVTFTDFTDYFTGGEIGWVDFNILGYSETIIVGDECATGDLTDAANQNLCPDESIEIASVSSIYQPVDGGVGVLFTPGVDGEGGFGEEFLFTEITLPFDLNSGLNGYLSANSLPNLSGTWDVSVAVYSSSVGSIDNICAMSNTKTVVFYDLEDSECESVEVNCLTDIPEGLEDECLQIVLADDPFCCDEMWDQFCEDAYQVCIGTDCYAGDLTNSGSQELCPNALTIIQPVTPVFLPVDGGVGILFTPGADGAGGSGDEFIFSEITFPFYLNSGLGGELENSSLPNLSGTWEVRIAVYSNPVEPMESICAMSNVKTVVFLDSLDADCESIVMDCVADTPYDEDDECVQIVFALDPFCCDSQWDEWCEDAYQVCVGAEEDIFGCNISFDFTPDTTGGNTIWITPSPNIYNALEVLWEFGDGNSSTELFPTHTYAGDGPYLLCLTVVLDDPDGSGTCTETHCEELTDEMINPPGMGSSGFSIVVLDPGVVSVSDALADRLELNLWPNPARDLVTVQLLLSRADLLALELYDISGKLVQQRSFPAVAGENQVDMDLGALPAGMYLLRVAGEQFQQSSRLIKQ